MKKFNAMKAINKISEMKGIPVNDIIEAITKTITPKIHNCTYNDLASLKQITVSPTDPSWFALKYMYFYSIADGTCFNQIVVKFGTLSIVKKSDMIEHIVKPKMNTKTANDTEYYGENGAKISHNGGYHQMYNLSIVQDFEQILKMLPEESIYDIIVETKADEIINDEIETKPKAPSKSKATSKSKAPSKSKAQKTEDLLNKYGFDEIP